VFCLTHRGATAREQVPYLGSFLEGVPVITVFGRHANSPPAVNPRKCVHFGWKDCMLPMMLDSQFSEDTVFLVFEEDWRMFAGFPEILEQLRSEDVEEVASAHADHSGNTSSQHQEEEVFNMKNVPMPAKGRAKPNRFLMDMVAAVNTARRYQVGDFVWLSWMCERKVTAQWPARPAYGSTLVSVSKAGARFLHQEMLSDKNTAETHIDVWMSKKMYHLASLHPSQQAIGASFARPTYGAFDAHASGCQPNIGVRQTQWHVQHVQQGTRPDDDAKGLTRKIVKWPRYNDTADKEQTFDVNLSCSATGWWISFTNEPSITKLMWPAHFKFGSWRPTQLEDDFEPWPGMKWVIPSDFWRAEVANQQEIKKKTAAAAQSSSSHAASGPKPPPATQRMKRNRRKLASSTALLRVWTKTLARSLIFNTSHIL